MHGSISTMPLFLLQDWVFWPEDDPITGIIVIIGVGVIIVFFAVYNMFGKSARPTTTGKGKALALAPRRFNIFTLRRIASSYGLDRHQMKLLEHIFRSNGANDPLRIMQDLPLLDRHFKRAFRVIEKDSITDDEAQGKFHALFSLRNTIEASSGMEDTSPARLSEKTPAILSTGKDNFPVKVITSRGNNVIIEAPRNSLGTPARFSKGVNVSLSFFTKSSNGFSLDGTIAGPVHTDFGAGLQIMHTGKVKPLVKRKFRRRQTSINAEFFFVNVVESGTGRKKTSKLVVDKRKFKGIVLDISAGGCALRSTTPVNAGSRLKIVIDEDDNYLINVLGQVIRTNRSNQGTIIHIKFLKVPRRAFNLISTMVFGYNEV